MGGFKLWGFLAASVFIGCGARSTLYFGPPAQDSGDASAEPSSGDSAIADVHASDAAAPDCQTGGDGVTNCAAGSESCCTSLEVEGGTYYRTFTYGDTSSYADPATVSSFRLDKYDVTVGRFRQFVGAWNSGWAPLAGSGKHSHLNGGKGLADVSAPADAGIVYETGWVTTDDSNIAPTDENLACDANFATWTATPGSLERLPINCVNWYEAYAFCIWDGGFLPSGAEWEYAAAGGSQQREYPWGATDPGTDNQYAIYGATVPDAASYTFECHYPTGIPTPCMGVMNIAPVGTAQLGAGLWGQDDLVGNMGQWDLESFYVVPLPSGAPLPYIDPCTDCAFLGGPSVKEVRGSEFDMCIGCPPGVGPVLFQFSLLDRTTAMAASRAYSIGMRCARSL
jgi:formylglycine-generating enzyme required for sulfatase activity